MADTKLDRLQSQLLTSGLQQKDNPLFQVISQLIGYLRQLTNVNATAVATVSGSAAPKNSDYITWTDELASLPNSRQLLAGLGINFDDSIAGRRTINGATSSGFWTPLTDGDVDEMDLISASGECIMVFVPTP